VKTGINFTDMHAQIPFFIEISILCLNAHRIPLTLFYLLPPCCFADFSRSINTLRVRRESQRESRRKSQRERERERVREKEREKESERKRERRSQRESQRERERKKERERVKKTPWAVLL